jgi:hypothetical protein
MFKQTKQKELTDRLAHAYFFAKKKLLNQGYADEIDWQDNINFDDINASIFLKEAAWVILASGMSDIVISRKFESITVAFHHWDIEKIASQKAKCRSKALKCFNNAKKIDAILFINEEIQRKGFSNIRKKIQVSGIEYLQTLPFIGPATSFHLAKNIGFPVAKPDRHLLRISKSLGYFSPHELCKVISDRISEKVALVDLVIWRYATLDRDYLQTINRFVNK